MNDPEGWFSFLYWDGLTVMPELPSDYWINITLGECFPSLTLVLEPVTNNQKVVKVKNFKWGWGCTEEAEVEI